VLWCLRWRAAHHPAGIAAGRLGRDGATAAGIAAVRPHGTAAALRRRRRRAHLHVALPRLELLLGDGLGFGVLLGLMKRVMRVTRMMMREGDEKGETDFVKEVNYCED